MFSISKALALIAILTAVWFGFRLIGRLDAARRQKVERPGPGPARPTPAATGGEDDGVLDLVKDKSGNYVAKSPRDDRV